MVQTVIGEDGFGSSAVIRGFGGDKTRELIRFCREDSSLAICSVTHVTWTDIVL